MARPDLVDSLTLVLTARCNLRCEYCYQDHTRARTARWEDLQPALDWALERAGSRLEVQMTGGEPLLAPDLVRRVLAHARRQAPPGVTIIYRLLTNGVLLDEEMFAQLVEHDAEVRVSVDGLPETQAGQRGARALAALAALAKVRRVAPEEFARRLTAVMTVTPDSVADMKAGVEHLLEAGFRQIELNPVLAPSPGFGWEGLEVLRGQFAGLAGLCRDWLREHGTVPVAQLRRTAEELEDSPGCAAAGHRNPVVDIDGELSTCTLFADSVRDDRLLPPDLAAGTRLGKPGTPGFVAQLTSFGTGPLRPVPGEPTDPSGLFGSCRDCDHRSFCHICPLAVAGDPVAAETGRVPDFLCAFQAATHEAWQGMPLEAPAAPAWDPVALAVGGRNLRDRVEAVLGPLKQARKEA